MNQHFPTFQINLERLRRGVFVINLIFVSAAATISYIYYYAFGQFYYFLILSVAIWCSFVQFSIRNRVQTARASARLAYAKNLALGIFGSSVVAAQIVPPIFRAMQLI